VNVVNPCKPMKPDQKKQFHWKWVVKNILKWLKCEVNCWVVRFSCDHFWLEKKDVRNIED
jgi:hypothetical protein